MASSEERKGWRYINLRTEVWTALRKFRLQLAAKLGEEPTYSDTIALLLKNSPKP